MISPIAQAFALISTLFITAIAVLYPHRSSELLTHWTTSGDLDMGFPLLILYLVFSMRNLNQVTQGKPNLLILLPFIVALSGIYFAEILDIKTVFFASLILMIASLTGLNLGWRAFQVTLLPLCIVSMAMPFWYIASAPLQSLSAIVVGKFVEGISITALVEGTYITLPNGTIHIAGGCSGLKYFLSAISLSFISSCWNHNPPRKVIISLLLATSLSILANWVRISILVIIGYKAGVDHPLMEDHDSLGWVVFAVLLLPWLWFEGRFGNTITSTKAPIGRIDNQEVQQPITAALILFCLTSLALPSWHVSQIQTATHDARPSYVAKPSLADAVYIPSAHLSWSPNFPHTERELKARYILGPDPVDVIVREYPNSGESELAKTTNDIFGRSWRKVKETTWQEGDLKLRIAIAKHTSSYKLIYYWYEHAGTMANTILNSKKEMLIASFGGHYYSQLFALALPCSLSCQNNQDIAPSKSTREFIESLRTQYTD